MDINKQKRITKEEIKHYLSDNAIIIEAGAHIGRDTVKMAKRWPDSHIHAFEPIPHLFAQLIENTKDLPNITCYNIALDAKTGKAKIYISSDRSNAASSLLKPKKLLIESPQINFQEILEIDTMTLDDWAKQYHIPKIDFMWLDMQGSEFSVLQASPNILSTVTLIYTEINITQRYENHPLYPEYKTWLELQGFKLVKEELTKITWGNALFLKNNS